MPFNLDPPPSVVSQFGSGWIKWLSGHWQNFKDLSSTESGKGADLVGSALRMARPEYYGALGDGSTDDSSAFTSALADSGVRGLFLDPSKSYVIGGITVPSNKEIYCNYATIIPNSTSATVFTMSKSAKVFDIYGKCANSVLGAAFTGKFYEIVSLASSFETDLTWISGVLIGERANTNGDGSGGYGVHINHNSSAITERVVGLQGDLYIYGFEFGFAVTVAGSGTGYVTNNKFKGSIKNSRNCLYMLNAGSDDFMHNWFDFDISPDNGGSYKTAYGVRLSGTRNRVKAIVWDPGVYSSQAVLFDANSDECLVETSHATQDQIKNYYLDQGSDNRVIDSITGYSYLGTGPAACPVLIQKGIRTSVSSGGGTSTVTTSLTDEDLDGDTLLVTVGLASAATQDVINDSTGISGAAVWDDTGGVWKVTVTNNESENLDIAWALYRL